jgi:hypothetical protein
MTAMEEKSKGLALAVLGLVAVLVWAWSLPGSAQEVLSSLYGSRNLQYINLRYVPLFLPQQGQGGEMTFGFNTMSSKTDKTDYKYFYGVSLGGGGWWWEEADLGQYGERNTSTGYILFQLENKIFATGKGPMRPYLGGSLSYGTGALWVGDRLDKKEDDDDDNTPVGGFDFWGAGVELGVMFVAENDYALTVAASMDARSVRAGTELKGSYPVMITVGLCKWLGHMGKP